MTATEAIAIINFIFSLVVWLYCLHQDERIRDLENVLNNHANCIDRQDEYLEELSIWLEGEEEQ